MRRRLATCVALAGALLCGAVTPAPADHTPPQPENFKWRATADNDFNLEVAFTATYPGGAFRDRVRDVVAQDPSCFAGSCSATSYSHWYLHRAQPYFGSEASIADADPTTVCPAVGQVAFHWLDITPLGFTRFCGYQAEPTRVHSATVTIDADPASAGSPAPVTWYTRGPGDDVAGGADVCTPANPRPGCVNEVDLMSVVAHEVGHVLGFGHYQESSPGGPSIDPVCLDGSTSGDPSLGDNTNRETMCSGIYPGTERQRTPEEHEKEAFANLYPPTGPAPTITPATQTTAGTSSWTVVVPRDSTRATSFHMIYGDGTYDTRAVAQGSGSATFSISHPFGATGTYAQRATIVESGAHAEATTVKAQSGNAPAQGGENFVGKLSIKGDRSANVATATGSQTYGCACESMTQSVSSSTAQATMGSGAGSFTITTARIDAARSLGTRTYNVNFINVGYSNHTTWINPSGSCMNGDLGQKAVNLGTISTHNGAATKGFSVPLTHVANTGSQEAAVCLADGNSGNMVPIRLIV